MSTDGPISDALRRAVRESDQNMHQIAQGAGISTPQLWHFMVEGAKRRDIRVGTTADKLAAYFGLRLVPADQVKPPKPAKKRPARKGKRAAE